MTKEIKLDEAEITAAATQEENVRLQSHVNYLTQRVIVLRALLNREIDKNKSSENSEEVKEDSDGTDSN